MRKLKPFVTIMLLLCCCWGISPLVAQNLATSEHFSHFSEISEEGQQNKSEVSMIKALDELSETYKVFFTYNTALLKSYRVSTEYRNAKDVKASLETLLKQTNFRVKERGKDNFVIVEKEKKQKKIGRLAPNFVLPKKNDKFPDRLVKVKLIDKTITGKVTDENGESLPGVNVLVKGTSTGTVTDVDGNYRLEVPTNNTVLVFSSIGYQAEEVVVGNQSTINIGLLPSIEQLSEVVVIGYGEKSRKLLTESIGTVSAEQIQKLPIASADQALQGRVSGVQITNTSGTPGAGVAVRIRGIGTVGNTQPLFVIDGVPVGNNSGTDTNPLSTINPNDIESMSVLKDASAAAVYGVRAANGVVLITTKRGKTGKPTIGFDGYYGIQQLPDLYSMNNTAAQIGLIQEANNNYNVQNNLSPGDDSFLVLHPDLELGSRYRDINSPWVKDITNENAPIQNYNLSVSGANDNLNYYVSAGVFGQESVINKWDLERYSFRANGDYKINERVKFGQTFTVSHQEVSRGVNAGGDGFLLANAARMPPFYEIYDTDNSVPGNRYGYEGNLDVAGGTIGNQNGINQIRDFYDRTTRLLGGLHAEIMLLEGLTFRSQASIDLSLTRNDGWNPGHTGEELGLNRSAQERDDSRGEGVSKVFTNTLTYDNTFKDHSFNLLLGIEYQKFSSTSLSGRAENFLSSDPDFYRVVKNGQDAITLGGGAGESAYVGYLSRLSYDFQNKYLFTATVRRDGTSNFSPDDNRRWGTFPSFSAAWRVSEESFFILPFISELKVRGSWGQLGNDQTTSFPHIFRVSVTPDYGLNGSNSIQAPAPINFVNRDVSWETVETLDAGIDVSFLDDKLSLLATYYRRTTKDFLINLPLPRISGFTSTPANVGEVRNTGIELELGYNTSFQNGINLGISGNFTTVNNELVSLTEGIREFTSSGQYRTAVGFPIGYFYGYQTDGIYQNETEVTQALEDASSPLGPRAGDLRFKDTNGPAGEEASAGQQFSGEADGRIDFNDRTYLGKTIPDFYYGLSINAGYKNFDLSILFQGIEGVQLYNEFRAGAESMTGGIRAEQTTTQNRWIGPGTSTVMPRAVATDPNNNNRFSERWIEDGNFIRLKNLQLGYSLPETLTNKINLRFYVTATNLLTITPYSGPDPEVFNPRAGNGSQLEAGTDLGNIPQVKMFQLGIQASF